MSTHIVERHLLVVFGATGDLAHRKVLPSLFRLDQHGSAKGRALVVGVARASLDDASFRASIRKSLVDHGENPEAADAWVSKSVFFQTLGDAGPDAFKRLRARLESLETQHNLYQHRIFYLALPLPAFPPTIEAFGSSGLNKSKGWTRLVVEKPFGHDLASAQSLNALVHRFFDEQDVYRLDHYLGKETVQNLIAFRFGNSLFEPLWNRDRVKQVEITVAEELGVEGRGAFYEKAGAVRDIMQNHMMQLLCLTAMEPPAVLDGNAVANEKVKVIQAMEPLRATDIVLGQYAPGELNGKLFKGYREEQGVNPESKTETFAAARLRINNWRWQGVPFFLRTGKRLPRKATRITVTFKAPPAAVFNPYIVCGMESNRLEITLQPNEGFNLSFQTKIPGEGMKLETQQMRFRYAETYGPLPEAYQTLMLDVMKGDRTLFVRNDEVEQSWERFADVVTGTLPVHDYPAGTWGPAAADKLLAHDDCCWTDPHIMPAPHRP
jgi:glucose-6-phosphate 1-dehydrogenase